MNVLTEVSQSRLIKKYDVYMLHKLFTQTR